MTMTVQFQRSIVEVLDVCLRHIRLMTVIFSPSQVLAAIFHFREFSNDSLLPAESWSRHSPRRRLLTWLYPQLRCLTDGYQRR